MRDSKAAVRQGYDAVSYRYRADDAGAGEYEPWLDVLRGRLRTGATVLDLGCGCGVPVARDLVAAGHDVTGVDISDVQIERARRLVPEALFIRSDFAELAFEGESFDAITCFYALIHVPLPEQPMLIDRMAHWLRAGGLVLATVGDAAWTGTKDGWLGGEASMWWSHAEADTYRLWFRDAGLTILDDRFVPEGSSGHRYLAAERR
ncbi:MAG: class I SAM-dependent methyltransferase [Pseudonocardiales bacterium]|nr:MAG: class I SAM-dependent methyltransferase [Pseudonocardiales bacterium]